METIDIKVASFGRNLDEFDEKMEAVDVKVASLGRRLDELDKKLELLCKKYSK